MNFKHLYYFWVTAKSGGVMRAGEQLHTTPQTLSGQIHLLEDWLGRKLFKKSGRNLELTETGRLALGYAEIQHRSTTRANVIHEARAAWGER